MPVFTKETAAAALAKSIEARRKNALERRLACARPVFIPLAEDSYDGQRLARLRMQLNSIDAQILTCTVPRDLDRLTAAQSRLHDQERALTGKASRLTGRVESLASESKVATLQWVHPAGELMDSPGEQPGDVVEQAGEVVQADGPVVELATDSPQKPQ